jgi:hypothetical protein
LVAKIERKNVTTMGWEEVNWSLVDNERDKRDRLGMPSGSVVVVSVLDWLNKCLLLKKHSDL